MKSYNKPKRIMNQQHWHFNLRKKLNKNYTKKQSKMLKKKKKNCLENFAMRKI